MRQMRNGTNHTKRRALIIRSWVDATDYDKASDRILRWAKRREYHHIIAANVHVVMTGFWHLSFQRVIDEASLVTPDGMPLVWAMRHLGVKRQPRVYGPDLMLALCRKAAKQGVSIYLYGGTEDTLTLLRKALTQRHPTLQIAGTKSPPFRSLNQSEEKGHQGKKCRVFGQLLKS